MLFDSTVRRELTRSFGAVLVIVLTIVLTSFLIRTVGQAASGSVAAQDVVLLLGYVTLAHLPTMMALSVFVAVVVALGRMYRDSEMAIWFTSGVGITRFVRPVLRTVWPVLLAVAVLTLVAWPWSNRNSIELRGRYQQRSDLSRVTPGVFQTSGDGRRVFFIERQRVDGVNARNVFILAQHEHGESVTSARMGRLENQGDARYLVLERGQRNDTDTRSGERTLSAFDSYRVLAGERAERATEAQPPKALRSIELIGQPTPRNQGELAWRIGLMLGAANLSLLAIGLAANDPRRARNWSLLFALLVFVVYYNLINLSQLWVAGGRLSLGAALLGLHGGALLVALALLWGRGHAAVYRLRPRAR
jgi:lipopolysaccharide export system permease protein